MAYSHLTDEERYHIYEHHVEGCNAAEIARRIGRHKSTVSRELKRGAGARGYRPRQAIQKGKERAKRSANGRCVATPVWEVAQAFIRKEWSPGQVSGRFRRDGFGAISHETLYKRIYADKQAGGDLHTFLRSQKKYGSGRNRRSITPDRLGIEHRPAVVARKQRVGDWEADTIVGKGQSQAIVSLVERKSKYTLLHRVNRKTDDLVTTAIVTQMAPLRPLVHTLTFDNGTEFCGHRIVARCLDTTTYFGMSPAGTIWSTSHRPHKPGIWNLRIRRQPTTSG